MQPEGNYEACCQKCKIATFMAGGNEMHCRNYHRNLLLWWEANCIGRCLFFWIHLYTPTILVATHILMEGGRKPSCLFLPVLRANSGGLTVKFNSLQGFVPNPPHALVVVVILKCFPLFQLHPVVKKDMRTYCLLRSKYRQFGNHQ